MTTTVTEGAWCVVVPHHPRGAHIARHRLASDLDGLVGDDRLADAVAIAAELVGNAVVHAHPLPGDVIRVAWRLLTSGGVEIRVTDGGSPEPPSSAPPAPTRSTAAASRSWRPWPTTGASSATASASASGPR